MDDGRGNLVGFETEEERDAEIRKRLAEMGIKEESDEDSLPNTVRRGPVPFDVGEKLAIKGALFEVEKIERKRLTLKPLARPG